MNPWEKLSSKVVKVGYKTATIKEYKMPDGTTQEYTTWYREGEQCIATIAITPDLQVVVARQFRPGPERIFDELPGGGADNGEDLTAAALRELREETGYETKEPLKELGIAYKDAYTNHEHHYYLARNCVQTAKQQLDDTEHIQIVLISIDELLENARSGKMSDGIAVLLAYDELKEIKHAKTSN